jgi:hypothetical protein
MKPYLLDHEIQQVQSRIRRDADRIRLAHISPGDRPGRAARLLARLGGWMVTQGTSLQARYQAGKGLQRPEPKAAEILFS